MWLVPVLARKTRHPARPRLEALEDRSLLSAGALDPTFGNGAGYVTTSLSSVNISSATSVLIQPDGKILASGSNYVGSKNAAPPQVFAVVRYNPDGSLDATFGSGGKAFADFPGSYIKDWRYAQSYASALYPPAGTVNDGKIVLAGDHLTSNNGDLFALARFNPNGTLDPTFGTAGEVTTILPVSIPLRNGAHGVVIQPDGKIVAGGGSANGFVLARYNTNGTLDTTFGSGGKVVTSLGAHSDVATLLLQPNGKLIVAGDTWASGGDLWEVARYNPNGSLDTSFGNGGIVGGTFGAGADVTGAALYPSGTANASKVVVVGSISGGGGMARYNPDGSLDSTFGTGGKVNTATTSPRAVAIEADGKLVIPGPYNGGPALSRFNPDGSADGTFGTGGISAGPAPFGPANAVALQPNGDIVVAGSKSSAAFAVARYLPSEPEIGSFTASASTVAAGNSVTLTASNITDGNPNGTVTRVAFYVQVNGTNTLLGYGTQASSGVWTFSFTVNLAPGTYMLFAQAQDSYGVFGDPFVIALTVQ
ncbi:MAG: hypothetical protein U0797_03810 [Gemmataceae bacterium]